MHSFGRALKLALAHRVNIVGCIVSACAVAMLWAGNLTAVYPVVQVIMNDQSLPQWVDETLAESDMEVAENTRWLAKLNELPVGNVDAFRAGIEAEIKLREAELDDHVKNAAGQWNDLQIAEKTRLLERISNLKTLHAALPGEIEQKVAGEKRRAENQIKVHSKRATRFGWIAPATHRWMPSTPFSTLMVVCLFVLVCSLLRSVFRVWNGITVSRLGYIVGYDLRMEFYRQVLRLDMASFTEKGRGDLMNRCTSDLNSVGQGVQRLFGQAMLEPLKVLGCVAVAAWISWRLLLLTIIIAPLTFYAIHYLGRALKRTHRRAMQELSLIYETLAETLAGIKLIKAFTMESAERQRFHLSAKEFYRRQMRIATYNSLVSPVIETLGMGMVLLASVMGGYLVLGQHTHILGLKISDIALTHGDMSVFFAMLAGMADPARRLSTEFSQIQQAVAAAERVYEVLDRQPQIVDPPHPLPLPRLTRSLRFEGVSFHYHAEKPVLREVNLEVRAGETLAVVGSNGCGKTTLLQLLPRFYDPLAGRITIEGVDIRDVRIRDLRLRMGLVSQDVLLFNDTIANNIAYGASDATPAQIEAAARKAHAHAFITEKLPEGYQSLVGPGGNRLSGGQRQRISLARAILRDPEILILDEATSQIDVESEQLIHQVLEEFSRDRTTLMITHRLSMLSIADRIAVMDQGRILDVGTHNELLARCEMYQRLSHAGYRESA
jgi:ATP-binding cassette subfamily B protein/subfamily B ATP-binding cassette protein MsbA